MKRDAGPLFVERKKYRRRRLMDAARILPVAGFVLFMLPMLWARGEETGIAGEAIYLFLVWAVLIVGAALIARLLGQAAVPEVSRPAPAAEAPPWATDLPETGSAGGAEQGDGTVDRPPNAPGKGKPGGTGSSGGGAAP
ncbi:MAG: hypothetical protein JJT95_15465 [Pararhodobacter sp.]|nr:hypothetical protein [Pararhodobacter sp.]